MSVVGGVWVVRGYGAYCWLELNHNSFSPFFLKVQPGRKFTGKEHSWVNQIKSIGSYCTAESFWLLLTYHTALTRKRCVSLRLYLFGKEGQTSSRPEIDCGQFMLLSLLPVSLFCPCFLAGMPVPCLCIADPDFLCFLPWELTAAASPGDCWTGTKPSCDTSPPWPWLTGARWGCASRERREEGVVLLLLASALTASLQPMACT